MGDLTTTDASAVGPQSADEQLKKILGPMVAEAVRSEEDRRFRQLKWIGAVVGIVGLGTFGSLATYLIQSAVDRELDARTGRISDAIEFTRVSTIAMKMGMEEGYSQPDLETVMNYLRSMKSDDSRRHSSEFLSALSQITIVLAGADERASVDEIFKAFESEIFSTPSLVEPLLHHYGTAIVGRWSEPAADTALEAFEKLERFAPSAEVAELALFYRTLFESRRTPGTLNPKVVDLVAAVSNLDGFDRQRYFEELFIKTIAENWMRSVTLEGKNIELISRSLLKTYRASFTSNLGSNDEDAVEILERAATTGVPARDVEFDAGIVAQAIDMRRRRAP